LDKNWGGSVFTERIIERMAKFFSALTFVFIAAFINFFGNWFMEDWTSWDFWSDAVFTFNLDDFPELTAFRVSVGNNFMSFGIEVGWFWSAVFSFVGASSESRGGITATVDTLVVTFPVITSFVAQSNGSVFVSTDVTWSANSFWTTSTLLFNWWTSAFAWSDKINGWTELSVAFAFVPLTKFVFSASFENQSVVIWATGFQDFVDIGWHVWTLFWFTFVIAAFFWTFPDIAAFIFGSSNVFWLNLFALAIWTGWFFSTWDSSTLDFVFSGTFAGFAWTEVPFGTGSSSFTVVVTVASSAWNGGSSKLVTPTVESSTGFVVIFVSTWWENFTAWKLASTVFWSDASFQVGEDHTFGALDGFFWFTEIDTGGVIVLALGVTGLHGVTSFVTFKSTDGFIFSSTWWSWAWSDDSLWSGHIFIIWGGWSTWSGVSWAWETNAFDFTVHAVATSASVGLRSNFFSFSVFNTIDFHTEAVFLFQAFSTVFRQDGVVDTFATFNTDFLAFFGDLIPSANVGTSQWASRNTWGVFSATVALHWAKTLVSPRNVNTFFVTSLSISGNSGTKAFAFSTGVTSTGVVLTVFKVVVNVDMSVAFGEWSSLVFKNGTSFGRPSFSEWVQSADISDMDWFWTGRNSFPGISEFKNVGGWDVGGGDQVLENGSIVVTAQTLDIGGFVGWVEFDHHMGTFVPHKSDSNFFGFNEYPKTGKSKAESSVSIGSDWRTSNNFDRRIADFEGDRFSTNSSFGTASFVSSGDFEFTVDFSVNIFAFSLELELMTIKSFNVGVTISFTSGWAFVISATPGTEFVTRANVTVFHESFVFSVRFSTVEAWALFSNDAGFGFFIKDVSFEALAAGFAVIIEVWVNFSVNMHVVASHLHWLFALNEFSIRSTDLTGSFAGSFGTFPSTFVAFADVAVLSSGFTSKVFSSVPVAGTFGWSNANTIVVQNSISDTLTTWNTSFNTFELLVLFVSEGTTRSVTSFTAFLEFLTGWAIVLAFSFFSPVFQNDTFFSTGHSVQSSRSTNVVHIWFSTVVLLALVHEWLVIDQVVTFFEFSRNKDVTQLFGNWVSGFVLDAWFQSVNSWSFITSFSLPFLDKFDDIIFDISFWGEEIIGGITVEVTAKTSEGIFVFGSRSEVNALSSIKNNSSTHTRDHQSLTIDSFNSECADVDW
jgi:hypothetical protein